MKVYRDKNGSEVMFPWRGTPRSGFIQIQRHDEAHLGPGHLEVPDNIRELRLQEGDLATGDRTSVVKVSFAEEVFVLLFDTEEEARDLYNDLALMLPPHSSAYAQPVGMDMEGNTVPVPPGIQNHPLMLLTWTIAGALLQYDEKIDISGDSTTVIDFVNSMGVETPM